MTPRVPPPALRRLHWLARPFVRLIYWITRRKLGHVVQPVQLAAYRPRLLLGVALMEDGQARSHALPAALKTLASMRASTRIGCPF